MVIICSLLEYGTVERVRMKPDSHNEYQNAYVHFETAEQATAALEGGNIALAGVTLVVRSIESMNQENSAASYPAARENYEG
jgi:S-adenosylmethionine:tRNA-ribosyltransferase-isomerase (queuine synthetase)